MLSTESDRERIKQEVEIGQGKWQVGGRLDEIKAIGMAHIVRLRVRAPEEHCLKHNSAIHHNVTNYDI